MDTPFEFEGRVWIRLSNIPTENLLAAAEKLTAKELKLQGDPMKAILASTWIRKVAEDPAAAAVEIPGECKNRVFSVSRAEYEKAMRVPKSRKAAA